MLVYYERPKNLLECSLLPWIRAQLLPLFASFSCAVYTSLVHNSRFFQYLFGNKTLLQRYLHALFKKTPLQPLGSRESSLGRTLVAVIAGRTCSFLLLWAGEMLVVFSECWKIPCDFLCHWLPIWMLRDCEKVTLFCCPFHGKVHGGVEMPYSSRKSAAHISGEKKCWYPWHNLVCQAPCEWWRRVSKLQAGAILCVVSTAGGTLNISSWNAGTGKFAG